MAAIHASNDLTTDANDFGEVKLKDVKVSYHGVIKTPKPKLPSMIGLRTN